MLNIVINQIAKLKSIIEKKRASHRWEKLQEMGMKIGKNAYLPMSTWIDSSHCYLISIGDGCRFGPHCVILAHDASLKQFLGAGKIGKVIIHEDCSIGFGALILPGVEIGPRAVIGAYSVVSANVPPDTVVSGNPAKVVTKLNAYLRYHRLSMKRSALFPGEEYGSHILPEEKRREILEKVDKMPCYIVDSNSEEIN